jgi:hypothetical protein
MEAPPLIKNLCAESEVKRKDNAGGSNGEETQTGKKNMRKYHILVLSS